MKLKIVLAVLIGLFLSSPLALADTFMGTSGGSWANLSSVIVDENGSPFWDNTSWDGGPQNIGFKMPSFGLANPQYWSIGGSVDNNVTFQGAGAGQTQTLLLEIAGNAYSNKLYAYNVAIPSERTLIFSGPASPVTTVSRNIPYAQYGYLLMGPGGTFYSGNSSNFAFFKDANLSGTWWFGVEDLIASRSSSDLDYNDLVVKVSTVPLLQEGGSPVPLPSSLLLLGSGVIGLLGLGWRRKTT